MFKVKELMIRIIHHRIRCIGCNYCVEVAPDRWDMSMDDGKSYLIDSIEKKGIYIVKASDDEYDSNSEAANICPINIIKVEKIGS